MLRKVTATITCAADGSCTVYAGSRLTGKILAIRYLFGNLAATVDFTITGETSGLALFTIADVAQANASWYPLVLPNKHTSGAAFTDVAGDPPRVYRERIKIVAAQGGNATSGSMVFYIEDEEMAEN